jgi:two-component system phosphate regulon sensor histidine kinase PhoR
MKQRRLAWQLYPSYLLLLLLVLLAISWQLSHALQDVLYQRTSADLEARAQLIKEQLRDPLNSAQQGQLKPLVERLGRRSETRVTIIRRDGLVLADSHKNVAAMDNHSQRPEIIEALAKGRGQSIRFSDTLAGPLMYVAFPLSRDGEVVATLRTAVSVSEINAGLDAIYRQLLFGGGLVALIFVPVTWFFSHRFSRPLAQMTMAAQRLSAGERDVPLAETGSAETRRLARALNRMAAELTDQLQREVDHRGEIEAILGCMVEGLLVVDNREQVIRINAAAAGLFGISAESEPNKPIQELIRHAELQRFVARALAAEGPLEEELMILGLHKRHLHVQAAPLTGNQEQRLGVLIVLHDLTRLKQLEAVRRDFVASVSHELKTPITAIRGAVETLLDEEEIDQASQQFLQIIFKQSERLNALVEDLLDLSRIEEGVSSGDWELRQEKLLPLLEGAKGACESLMAQQQAEVKIHCSQQLVARINAQLLEQAIINLLSNAIKYSDSSQAVILRAEETNDKLIIAVQDFGIGIESKHLPRLFERFYRVDQARSRKLGGTGLGLAIVKHIAYAHCGEVDVSSTLGQGSTFRIILPKIQRLKD